MKKDLAKVSGKKTESVFTPLTEAEKNANQAEVVRLLSQNEELELGKKDYAASVNKTVKDNKKTISELCREVKKGKETFKGVQK